MTVKQLRNFLAERPDDELVMAQFSCERMRRRRIIERADFGPLFVGGQTVSFITLSPRDLQQDRQRERRRTLTPK